MSPWFTPTRKKLHNVIAMDIGTASVSVACARVSGHGTIEVIAVFRYPFDLMRNTTRSDGQRRMIYMMKTSLAKAFADARNKCVDADDIRISFADPFFEERDMKKTITRKDPKQTITKDEINAALRDTSGWELRDTLGDANELRFEDLAMIAQEVSAYHVNGYPVTDAAGYRGQTIEVFVRELFVSGALKLNVEEQKEKYYPGIPIRYYSDPRMLSRTLSADTKTSYPALIIDIGGETTALFEASEARAIRRADPVFFGLRTLERRLATFLKLDVAHAEAIVRQYVSGALDDTMKKKVDPILQTLLVDWSAALRRSLQRAGIRKRLDRILVVGSGRDVPAFGEYINTHMQDMFDERSAHPAQAFTADTSAMLPPGALSQGGDIILTSLILYGDAR